MTKTSAIIVLLTGILLLPACKFKGMYDEKDNLEILRKNVEAGHIKMAMVKEINHSTGDTTNFIELTFTNSPLFSDPDIDLSYLASRCAVKAYQLFNPATWEGKDGVSIVLKNDGDQAGTKRFYGLDDLRDVSRIIARFDRFIGALEKARTYHFENNTNKLLPADSAEIASFFDPMVLAKNPNLVHNFLEGYSAYNADLDKADRRYFFKGMTVTDTAGTKITTAEAYQIHSTFIIPVSNALCRMECLVFRNNPEKFMSLDMFEKENHEAAR
jgi:hypothetical protein